MIRTAIFTRDGDNRPCLVVHNHMGDVDYKPLTQTEIKLRLRELADLLVEDDER